MKENKKVLVILGPTASGKTKLAIELAKKFNGEIISADSRQVYRGMDIGTGKDLAEYGDIKFHLIDVADPTDQFSVANYQQLAYQAIDEILSREKLPIVCGGTGLYISAIVEGYVLPEKQNTQEETRDIREKLDKMSLEEFLVELEKIDPETFAVIDQKNCRRVQRALEIFYQTGVTKSAQISKQKPPYDFLQIGINLPKETLYTKIDKRLIERLEKEGIIVNKNTIPFDTRSPVDPSGLRLGTAAETTCGKKEQDFIKIAREIDRVLRD